MESGNFLKALIVVGKNDLLVTALYLTDSDWETYVTDSFDDAAISIKRENFDLILVELGLEGNSSADISTIEEFVHFIRDEQQEITPILISTGALTKRVEEVMALGANGIIQKPYGSKELLAATYECLKKSGEAYLLIQEELKKVQQAADKIDDLDQELVETQVNISKSVDKIRRFVKLSKMNQPG